MRKIEINSHPCGVVTGAYITFGLFASDQSTDNAEAKGKATFLVRKFEEKYLERVGTTSCREILGVDMNTEEGATEANERNLYGTVCVNAIEEAVKLAEEILEMK